MKYLDLTGLQKFWTKVKNHVQTSLQGYAKTSDIPDTSNFVSKDESGGVLIQTKLGNNTIEVYEDEQESYISIGSNALGLYGVANITTHDGNYGENGQVLMIEGGLVTWGNPSGGTSSGSSNSIPFTYFTCYSPSRTVRELIDQLANEDVDTTDSITAVVTFSAMLSGTFLCDISHYYGDYYGCKFTDLTNLKTYYFEGESRSISLYDNLSGGSSGEASMPRIRLSNWEYITPAVMINRYPPEFEGEIKFSICVQDGVVQEGDELEICALRKTYGKYKLRQFSKKVITAEDIENLAKQPYIQIIPDVKYFFRTDSAMEWNKKPKYIRIRRPIYKEDIEEPVSAIFSNVVPVDIGLRYTQ